MKATVIENTAILIPNKDHQNFTETKDSLKKGDVIDGTIKHIEGLRRGVPFTYKMFFTDKGQIIYLNKIKPMDERNPTEVTLGADAQVSPTKINFIPNERFSKSKKTGLVVGAIAGYAYAKYKKHDTKKIAMYIGLGMLAGYAAAYLYDNKNVGVTESK